MESKNLIRVNPITGEETWFPIADLDKVNLYGPSSNVFIRDVKEKHSIEVSIKNGIFDAIIAKLFADGVNPKEMVNKELLYNPYSWCNFLIEGKRAPITSINCST